mgnify:FL=1
MYIYNSIPHIVNTLNLGKELLQLLFEKRKSLPFRYEYALDIIDEHKLNILIEREVIRRNGPYIELDEHYLSFIELLLEANEEISTAVIDENIQLVCQLIDYYQKEDAPARKVVYLRSVKAHLRKMGKILVRNVVSLQRVIDNTFKNEPSYKVKIAKLENLDAKRIEINRLIHEVERLLEQLREGFFAVVPDEELRAVVRDLRGELLSAGHSLIHSQQDIIDYLNQIRAQVSFTRKLRRVKYLREQFELLEQTNVSELVEASQAVVIEGVQPTLFKVSIPYLQTDEALEVILKVADGLRPERVVRRQELGALSAEQMESESVGETAIDTRKLMDQFAQSDTDLFSFLMRYGFSRPLDFEARVTLFCRLLSLYEQELLITNQFGHTDHVEYAIIRKL